MTAFADMHELVNRLSGGNSGLPQPLFWHKEGRVAGAAAATPTAGSLISTWEYEGAPSHGAVPPTSATICGSSTQGGWKQNDPSGGRQLWSTFASATCSVAGTLWLCDRLGHISGLSGTTITAQTVGITPTRFTTGVGVMAAVEIYTALGATSTTITGSYTNQASTAGQTTQSVVIGNTGFKEAQRFLPLSWAAGDNGVQSLASVTLAASTLTAGNFGVVLYKPLAQLAIGANGMTDYKNFVGGPLMEYLTNACLFWLFRPVTATVPQFDLSTVATER